MTMQKTSNGKDRWKTLVRRAVSQDHRMNTIMFNEWQGFSNSEIDLLLQLKDVDIGLDSIKIKNDFLQILQNSSSEFIEKCLLISMGRDQTQFTNKFLPLFEMIDQWIIDGILINCDREKLLNSLLLHLIEHEDEPRLKLLLSNTSDVYQNRTKKLADQSRENDNMSTSDQDTEYPGINSTLLIRACEKNNFELVRILILAGYR